MPKPPNEIKKEPQVSDLLRDLLKKNKITTFKKVARYKRYTLLRRIPKLKVKHLEILEKELARRSLQFVADDTILVSHVHAQHRLRSLWEQNIYRHRDLNKYNFWEIIQLLGGYTSGAFSKHSPKRWMGVHNVTPSQSYELHNVGLTVETEDALVKAGICTFAALVERSDEELACWLMVRKHSNMGRRLPNQTGWSEPVHKRLREIKYVLWKHGYYLKRPCRPL